MPRLRLARLQVSATAAYTALDALAAPARRKGAPRRVACRRGAIALLTVSLIASSWGATAFAQATKPRAIAAPVAYIGDVSEAERGIIHNSLHEQLTGRFQIVSKEEYEAAQERVFAELDIEQCTVDQCIRKIQEFLQAERFFVLQIIRQGTFSQLSLTLVTLEDKTVKTANCRNCDIGQINEAVAGLVAKTLGTGREPIAPAPGDAVAPAPSLPQPVKPRLLREPGEPPQILPASSPADRDKEGITGYDIWGGVFSALGVYWLTSSNPDIESQSFATEQERDQVRADSRTSRQPFGLLLSGVGIFFFTYDFDGNGVARSRDTMEGHLAVCVPCLARNEIGFALNLRF